jgi:hypothetical protein
MTALNTFYVYTHKNPSTGEVFYIGKGKGKRAYSTQGRNENWNDLVSKNGFEVVIEKNNLTDSEANELEKDLIMQYGYDSLTNITLGGKGGDTISKNPNRSEIVAKISMSNSGEKNPNYGGKLHNDDYLKKQKLSNSKKPLLVIDSITNEKWEFINSKEVALFLNAKHSAVRTCKNKYKLKRRYLILDKIA